MTEKKNDKSLIMCIVCCIVPFLCYGSERLVKYLDITDKIIPLVLAIVFTALTGLLFFGISKIKNAFYGLLASILAFKMMPPMIAGLFNSSVEGQAVYTIVRMAALFLFASLIIKFFKIKSQSDNPIQVLPIIALVFTMLILREYSNDIYNALYLLTNQSLYGVYFAQAAIYLWCVLIILIVTIRSNYETIKFVSTFEIIAMGINMLRRLGTIIFYLIAGSHISASYYCWIVIYLGVMLVFALLPKKMAKKLN